MFFEKKWFSGRIHNEFLQEGYLMGFLVYSNNMVNMCRESFHLHNIRTRFFLGLKLFSGVEGGGE